MTRRRFAKLPAAQQEAIHRAALSEFAAHGFQAASLNRIIEAAGISKGSLYYYFDSKEDLYLHVTRGELAKLFESTGPFPVPEESDPDEFWSCLADYYVRLMTAIHETPQVAALARDWLSSSMPALAQAETGLTDAVLPWFADAIQTGRRVGAVRHDLPQSLLMAVVLGMGQAMDGWLILHAGDLDEVRRTARAMIGMIRRALEP